MPSQSAARQAIYRMTTAAQPIPPVRLDFDSCGEAKMELFDYIEVFYKQRRRHSTVGQISPAEFEQPAARHLFLPAKRTRRTAIN